MMTRVRGSRLVWLFAGVLVLSSALLAQEARQAQSSDPLSEDRLMVDMHSITSQTLYDYVKLMASPKYEGRLTGTPAYDAIARWAADLMASWKIKPAGDQGAFYQKFPDPYTLVLPGGALSLEMKLNGEAIRKPYVLEDDFFPGSTSDSGTVTAEVVYVGYGTTAPELGYDDYAGVDVKGKLVMVEPESPVGPNRDAELFKKWRPYSFHDYKMQNAAKHGAVGVIYNYHLANPNGVFVKGLGLTYVGPTVWNDVFAMTSSAAFRRRSSRRRLRPAR
jgi:hypothetical protein